MGSAGPAAIRAASEMPPIVATKDRRPVTGPEFVVDDWLWVKSYTVKAGEMIEQHVHLHDHVTLVASGSVRLWIDDQDAGRWDAPVPIKINALARHKFVAITDAVICCIHRLRDGEPEPPVADMHDEEG